MAKKTVKPKVMWGVLQERELVACYPSFEEAKQEAEDTMESDDSANMLIIEIVKAWELGWPQEPDPEIWEIGLDTF